MNELKIIAIGGAGACICKHAIDSGMKANVVFIDKDKSLLEMLGLGTSTFIAMVDVENKIEVELRESKIVVIVGGVAGETTSKYMPLIAETAKRNTDEIICFASFPFDFEGTEKVERSKNVCKSIYDMKIKCFTASLQSLMEQGYYKTQKQMFNAISEEFLEILKKELRQ